MANQLTQLPWLLDTTGLVASYPLLVHHFEFFGYSVATDEVVLKNKDGDIVWQAVGDSDFTNVKSFEVGWINGLDLDTLTAGTGKVLVYLQ